MSADGVRVREAGAGDLAEIEELWLAWARETGWPPRPLHPATVAAIRAGGAPGLRVFVARRGRSPQTTDERAHADETVAPNAPAADGFASVYVTWDLGDGPGAWLADLYVVPAARRCGVGRALVGAVAGAARAAGAGFLAWHVDRTNESAQRFYERMGASARPGHLFMSLALAPPPAGGTPESAGAAHGGAG